MALEKAELRPPARWFLIAGGGDRIVQLHNEIRIGEDVSGALILDPPAGSGMVAITPLPRRVVFRCLTDDATLVDTKGRRRIAIEVDAAATVALVLPNNSITVTGDPVSAGRATQRVRFVAAPSRHPLSAPRRHGSEIVDDALPGRGDVVEGDGIPTMLRRVPGRAKIRPPGLDREPSGDLLAPILVQEAVPELSLTRSLPDIEPQGLRSAAHPRGGSAVELMLLCLLLTGIVGRDSFVGEPVSTVLAAHRADVPRSLKLFASSVTPLKKTEADGHDRAPPFEPVESIEPFETIERSGSNAGNDSSTPAEANEQLVLTVDIEQQRILESQLLEAQRLLDAGEIIAPEGSAVKLLERILGADPTNERALQLMFQCATQLLTQAQAAHASGDDFEARNLVEEVLAFHPTHEAANDLWTRFVTQRASR